MSPESHDTPPLIIEWSGLTHPGKFRKNNEDAFLALTFDAQEVMFLGKTGESSLARRDFVFAVSDGMGGANAGEFASRLAVEKITRLLPKSYRLVAGGLASGIGDAMVEVVDHVHQELDKLGRIYGECEDLETPLSEISFAAGWILFCHIGDSRIYFLPKGGSLQQISHDHSYVGWLRREGKINEREARFHPRKSILNQALGAGHQTVDPHLGAVGCQPGDRFLLCTDGVIDGLWDARLAEYLSLPSDAGTGSSLAQHIVGKAVEESGRDNSTAVVVEIREN